MQEKWALDGEAETAILGDVAAVILRLYWSIVGTDFTFLPQDDTD